MKQEDKVCTPEQAKRIIKLGVVLETEKYWIYQANDGWFVYDYDYWYRRKKRFDNLEYYPAPDVAELGEVLGGYTVMKYQSDSFWRLYDETGELRGWFFDGKKPEAQARCAALIWLVENKYIEL